MLLHKKRNKPYYSTSCSHFVEQAEALHHSLQILHVKWSITLFNCFLYHQKGEKKQCLNATINEVNMIRCHNIKSRIHTTNSSGVEFKSHNGICWDTTLTSFPSPPLSLSSCGSKEPSSSWPSYDELKKKKR